MAGWALSASGAFGSTKAISSTSSIHGTHHIAVLIWLYYLPRSLKEAHYVDGCVARKQSGDLEPGTGAFTATMNLAVFIVIAAVLALGIILRLAITQSLQTRRSADLNGSIRPIDIEAFRNLIDPAEDDYLRHRLPSNQFRMVRRERLRAMAAYVHLIANNAVVLIRVGQAALASGDARIAEAARQLVDDSLLLRRNATVALARIYFALAWPNSGFAAIRVADRYEQLSGAAMLLGRLQNPAVAVRLAGLR